MAPGNDVLKKRHHLRVRTDLPAEFKLLDNGEITLVGARILNLSEGGVLSGNLVVMRGNTQEIVNGQEMLERESTDLKFTPNGDSTTITTRGRCARAFMTRESLYVVVNKLNLP
ncbi:MAG: hypothetical protein HUU08_12515 [Candidatus Brocadia sp.]|nr:hypothetical protein [Candidatus Brocadia sp.]